jgi:hypothetical protein
MAMRFVLGAIVGALLVIGAAYIHDAGMLRPITGQNGPLQPLVNWDQFIAMFGR